MNIEEIKKRHATEIMFLPIVEGYNQSRNDVEYLISIIEEIQSKSDIWKSDFLTCVDEIKEKAETIKHNEKIIRQVEKALQYYDTLYANIESNIQHGELITDWLKIQGETARTALKSIQGEE